MVAAGVIPIMIDYVLDVSTMKVRSRTSSIASPRSDIPVHPKLRALVESFGDQKVVAAVRGLPGSGKSNLAQQVGQLRGGALVCSADAYFLVDVDGQPTFQFEPKKLQEAHRYDTGSFTAPYLNLQWLCTEVTNRQ